ncbi:MAG: hypothetical protein LBP38_06225 [Desulfovibrio sp.]|nr:hypothetical protein [Desulfovibrio sp.]
MQRAILDVLHALDAATLYKNADDFAKLLAEALGKAKVRVKVKLWREIVFALSEKDATADVCVDEEGNQIPDSELTGTEQIPLEYPGGIAAFMEKEVLPYAPDAWVDESNTQIGYEISFTKHFYKPVQLRELADIVADIRALEAETEGLLDEVMRDAR